MKDKIKYFLILVIIAFGQHIKAQHDDHIDHQHEHPQNEIGVANALVYFINEQEFAYGLHLHYVHTIKKSKFGVGLGYERIFDKHKHNTIGIVGSYRPVDRLDISVSPGIAFEGTEYSDAIFSLHIETTYGFEVGDFHIGPLLEFAFDRADYHISIGIHVGYGF